MGSTTPGHVKLNGQDYVLADKTYRKQLQTAFNPRFSTGDQSFGDLSFFQFLAMEDFSGGNGQEIFSINNRFDESEGVDITTPGELKLAPAIDFLTAVNGPQHEHLNEPVEDEDAWPQVIDWLGQAVFYNDRIDFDAGGVEFLEVFETEIPKDKVLVKDNSGLSGTISNDTRAKIISISSVTGLPGDTFQVTVEFGTDTPSSSDRVTLNTVRPPLESSGLYGKFPDVFAATYKIHFRLYFGGGAAELSPHFSEEVFEFQRALVDQPTTSDAKVHQLQLNKKITVTFTMVVPNLAPGIHQLSTAVGWGDFLGPDGLPNQTSPNGPTTIKGRDDSSASSVQFFIESIDDVIVERKDLYAPQLKAATVSGSKLVGGRVFDSVGYIEVYQEQNEAVDRILQINLSDAGASPSTPTYIELVGSKGVIITALDNQIYSIDIETAGLTDAQRVTLIGAVPGTYVSGMALWNQRIYIASFDKSEFTSHISWTDGVEIVDSYAIDGKFWIRDLANFQGGLFYCGGTQDGEGRIVAFPSEPIMEVSHPAFDNAIRTLNAGRKLYAGWSHGTGIIALTQRGVATWAKVDIGEESTNIVWDLEEVGDDVYMLANHSLFKTTPRFQTEGFMESSKFGGNTPLIKKEWDSILVETDELEGTHKVRVLVNGPDLQKGQWTLLGEMTQTDGEEKEFFFPLSYTAQWVKVRIELVTEDPKTTPVVKRVLAKYFPSSLNKLQWGLAIRADSNLEMLNGQKEKRTGATIISDIFGLRNIGKVTFVDIDESEFTVVISDIKSESPLVNKEDGIEGIVSLELLEA